MSDNAAVVFGVILTAITATGGGWWLWRWSGTPSTPDPKWTCLRCGTVGDLAYYDAGSMLAEILLWCVALLPGFLYHLWRKSNSYYACPTCGSKDLVPEDSPRAKQIAEPTIPRSV